MANVCPLGLCRTEEDCPNAPCVDCMRRLGEHMIAEVQLLSRQALAAKIKGDRPAMDAFKALLSNLGLALTMQEMTSDAGNLSKLSPGQEQAKAHTLI